MFEIDAHATEEHFVVTNIFFVGEGRRINRKKGDVMSAGDELPWPTRYLADSCRSTFVRRRLSDKESSLLKNCRDSTLNGAVGKGASGRYFKFPGRHLARPRSVLFRSPVEESLHSSRIHAAERGRARCRPGDSNVATACPLPNCAIERSSFLCNLCCHSLKRPSRIQVFEQVTLVWLVPADLICRHRTNIQSIHVC